MEFEGAALLFQVGTVFVAPLEAFGGAALAETLFDPFDALEKGGIAKGSEGKARLLGYQLCSFKEALGEEKFIYEPFNS